MSSRKSSQPFCSAFFSFIIVVCEIAVDWKPKNCEWTLIHVLDFTVAGQLLSKYWNNFAVCNFRYCYFGHGLWCFHIFTWQGECRDRNSSLNLSSLKVFAWHRGLYNIWNYLLVQSNSIQKWMPLVWSCSKFQACGMSHAINFIIISVFLWNLSSLLIVLLSCICAYECKNVLHLNSMLRYYNDG